MLMKRSQEGFPTEVIGNEVMQWRSRGHFYHLRVSRLWLDAKEFDRKLSASAIRRGYHPKSQGPENNTSSVTNSQKAISNKANSLLAQVIHWQN